MGTCKYVSKKACGYVNCGGIAYETSCNNKAECAWVTEDGQSTCTFNSNAETCVPREGCATSDGDSLDKFPWAVLAQGKGDTTCGRTAYVFGGPSVCGLLEKELDTNIRKAV